MGIDNDAVLIYGWTFEYEDFCNRVKEAIGEETYEDFLEKHDFLDLFDHEHFKNHTKEFKFGMASPYYDSAYAERTCYISFEFENTEELYELMKDHRENGLDKYDLLRMLKIVEPPQVCALPHIW